MAQKYANLKKFRVYRPQSASIFRNNNCYYGNDPGQPNTDTTRIVRARLFLNPWTFKTKMITCCKRNRTFHGSFKEYDWKTIVERTTSITEYIDNLKLKPVSSEFLP